MKNISRVFLLLLLPLLLMHCDDDQGPTVRADQMERYGSHDFSHERQWDSLRGYAPRLQVLRRSEHCPMKGVVFGWHPYWMGSAYEGYDFSLLTDLAYFSYEVDPRTGSYRDIHAWKTTDLLPRAKAAGVRVSLCATLSSDHELLLNNPAACRTLIDSLTALVALRDADGVNIDFEGMDDDRRDAFTAFIQQLSERLHRSTPGARLSIALPGIDHEDVFDVKAMAPYVDLFLIMGYDYHWRSDPIAGPVAPKDQGTLWKSSDVTTSISYYRTAGIPADKLALAVPYYGYNWPTESDRAGVSSRGHGTTLLYSDLFRTTDSLKGNSGWDQASSTPYYTYRINGRWHQIWYDDARSLGLKYDLAMSENLAGIGIWALGYDENNPDLWDLLWRKFTDCGSGPCNGIIIDQGRMGGDTVAGESYIYSLDPEGSRPLSLTFDRFDVGGGVLSLFNGADATATLIGRYSGTMSPGTVTASSGAVTIGFVSKKGDTVSGWQARWECVKE